MTITQRFAVFATGNISGAYRSWQIQRDNIFFWNYFFFGHDYEYCMTIIKGIDVFVTGLKVKNAALEDRTYICSNEFNADQKYVFGEQYLCPQRNIFLCGQENYECSMAIIKKMDVCVTRIKMQQYFLGYGPCPRKVIICTIAIF